jgi:metal-dependent amidase/aminoacylase/carboxypeptidase family protein
VTKEELRAELERQAQRFKNIYGGEVTTYAAQPTPDRKPWRKKPSVMDRAFEAEVQKIAEQKAKEGQEVREQEA